MTHETLQQFTKNRLESWENLIYTLGFLFNKAKQPQIKRYLSRFTDYTSHLMVLNYTFYFKFLFIFSFKGQLRQETLNFLGQKEPTFFMTLADYPVLNLQAAEC